MQNARRAHKIRLCGHLRRYKKIVKKTYIIYLQILYIAVGRGKVKIAVCGSALRGVLLRTE